MTPILGSAASRTWNLIEDTFTSPRSLLLVAAIVVAWVVLARWVLPRFIEKKWVVNTTLGVVVVALLWFVLDVPSFYRDEQVDDVRGDELAAALADEDATTTSSSVPPMASAPPPEPTTTMAPQPRRLLSGALQSIDYTVHSGEGVVVEQPGGEKVVLLQDLNVDPGPDYFVYLVPGADKRSPEGGVELGPLPGNVGNPTFDVPGGYALSGEQTILIWCKSFASPVANAWATVA